MDGQHVVILGAGFSRAISSNIPDSQGLARSLKEDLGRLGHQAVPWDADSGMQGLEAWISASGEDAFDRALASSTRHSLLATLAPLEAAALAQRAPAWLTEMLHLFHSERAAVMTFNYDSFIEAGVASSQIWPALDRPAVSAEDILGLEGVAQSLHTVNEPSGTFRLLKLQGSLDWLSQDDDQEYRWLHRAPSLSRFDAAGNASHVGYGSLDRERIVLPRWNSLTDEPCHHLLRDVWQRAAMALHSARRVTMIGYSLGGDDSEMRSLVGNILRDQAATVEIVDLDPLPAYERLIDLGIDEMRITALGGDRCIENYVAREASIASYNLVRSLVEFDWSEEPDVGVQVPWGGGGDLTTSPAASVAVIADLQRRSGQDGKTLVLLLRPFGTGESGLRLDEVLPELQGHEYLAVRAFDDDGEEPAKAIDAQSHPAESGATGATITLFPARGPAATNRA